MIKNCPHCKTDFESNHGRQIYCSNSHRVSAYHKRKGFKVVLMAPEEKKEGILVNNNEIALKSSKTINEGYYKDSFLKQTTTATVGSLAANGLIALFTKEENKPATKKDLVKLFNAIRQDQQFYYELILKKISEK